MRAIYYFILFGITLLFTACGDADLDPTLSNNKDAPVGINNLEDLSGAANGMYDRMTVTNYYGRNMQIYGEVRSDNCFANGTSGRFVPEAQMIVNPENSNGPWEAMYAVVASANFIIQQDLEKISGDIQQLKQIVGQAYIVRALAHFDLLRLYGQQHASGTLGVPYVKIYKGDESQPERNTVEENKKAIFEDIEEGLSLMSETYNPKSKHFISTYAAYALKARVALYFKEWQTAKSAANFIVDSGKFEIADITSYNTSWKTKEAANSIFELAFSTTDNNGFNSLQFIYRGATYGDVEVLDDLKTIFDITDIRNSPAMIGNETVAGKQRLRNLGKYPTSDFSDNIAIMRVEEVVLILAEAKFELDEPDALEILNRIPVKRMSAVYSVATKSNLLLERRKELCFEGFRFDDLARTGSDIPLVDQFRQTHGGPKYGNYKYAFPIPTVEMNANSNMVQNEEY